VFHEHQNESKQRMGCGISVKENLGNDVRWCIIAAPYKPWWTTPLVEWLQLPQFQ
jgi:hypothetical protein